MTRKDYKKFAELMEALQHQDLKPYFTDEHWIYLFKELNHIFKSDNSNLIKENKSSLPNESLNQDSSDLDDEIPF